MRITLTLPVFLLFSSWSLSAPADVSRDLAKLLEKSDVPGMAAVAVLRDQIVAGGAAGIRKVGEKTPVTIDDKFHIGSNTKSMTATLAAILVRENKISWKTTVGNAFKKIEIQGDSADATLEQLLSNTGGAPGDFRKDEWARVWQLEGPFPKRRLALAEMILVKKPAYPPGKGYLYSNAGFSMAGSMLERAAGASYEDLMVTHIFKPLAMKSAGFGAPGVAGKIAQPYGHRPGAGRGGISPVEPGPRGDNPPAIAPAGAVHCSMPDLAKYARAHLGFGPDGFLTVDQLDNLHRPRIGGDNPYALGWLVLGERGLVHIGSNTMWYCYIFIDPKREFAAVAAANSGTDSALNKCTRAVKLLAERFSPP